MFNGESKFLPKMKKLILIPVVFLFLITLVSASSYVFEKDKGVNLKIPCVDEVEQPCNSSVHCNITILKPDGTILVENGVMTHHEVYYNYNLKPSQTNIIGEHSVSIFCSGIGNGFSTFTYEISETGEKRGNYRIAIYVMVALGWLLLILGLTRGEYTFTSLAGVILLISGTYIMINGIDNFKNTLTTAFAGIHILMGGYVSIRSAYEVYKDTF
jgi:hypothetical protein